MGQAKQRADSNGSPAPDAARADCTGTSAGLVWLLFLGGVFLLICRIDLDRRRFDSDWLEVGVVLGVRVAGAIMVGLGIWKARMQFSIRFLLALMLVVALVLGLSRWYDLKVAPPPCATVAAIEARYAPQLARLRALAVRGSWPAAEIASDNPINVKLFASDEILSAGFGQIVDDDERKGFDFFILKGAAERGISCETRTKPSARVECPVSFVQSEPLADGTSRRVVVYEKVIERGGARMVYRMEFDLAKRESIAENEKDGPTGSDEVKSRPPADGVR